MRRTKKEAVEYLEYLQSEVAEAVDVNDIKWLLRNLLQFLINQET